MTFFGDYGAEFQFGKLRADLKKRNSILYNVGVPTKKKLGSIERLIRTLREKISFNQKKIHSLDQYRKEFEIVLKVKFILCRVFYFTTHVHICLRSYCFQNYNKTKHSAIDQSPAECLYNNIPPNNPTIEEDDKVCLKILT